LSARTTVEERRFDCLNGEYAKKKRDLPAEVLGLKRAAPHKRPDLKVCLAVLDWVKSANPSTDKPVASMLQKMKPHDTELQKDNDG
jgi:hypothetical protein